MTQESKYANLRELVRHAAEHFPETRFFLCQDERLPFLRGKELYDLCGRAAGALSMLPKKSHIAILGPGSAAWLVAYFAVVSAGHVIVPMHDGMRQGELDTCIRHADCVLLLYDSTREKSARELQKQIDGLRIWELHDFLYDLTKIETSVYPPLQSDEIAAMYFTSGTTARSRCVMLTHNNIGSEISAICSALPLSEKDIGLSLLPLSHTFEMMTYIAGALHCGGTLYINESVRTVKRNLRDKHPTILVVVPLILQTLRKEILATAKKRGKLEHLERVLKLNQTLQKFGLDLSQQLFPDVHAILGGQLHTVICGGAALDPDLIRFFHALGIEVLQGYGITECSPVVTMNPPGHNRIGSVGKCLSCCEVMLQDREICVRGASVSPGYYKDPEANVASFRAGWFHTGDLGRFDQKGYLYFTGRLKNLIILANGENVSPEELEERLYQIDGILDAVVYEKEGIIRAELYVDRNLIPDATAAWKFVTPINRSMASYKQIGEIVLRDTEFEKTVTRKIKRYKLERSE
ncbi:MAG: AMP-binding protein [Oscillospiraceae bacterium]|nr:AMP-binding protein [Oscillospiraceae bacterium]